MKDDTMCVQGVVVETFRGGKFKVKLQNDTCIIATISGRMQKNMVKVLVADTVIVELGMYDTTKGRIINRVRN